MPQVPEGFIPLSSSVYQSLADCLRDMPMPRYIALFVLFDKTVALHDGHSVTGIGPEYPEIFGCLDNAMGDKTDGVIVLDNRGRQAWWVPKADATEFLAQNNPPTPQYLRDADPSNRIVH
jgi:hypothetical protein